MKYAKIFLISLLFLSPACSDNSGTTRVGNPTTSTEVGTAGASLTLPGDVGTLVIPANALSETQTITITRVSPSEDLAIDPAGYQFNFEPAGLAFSTPATITLPYDSTDTSAASPENLAVYWTVPGSSTVFTPVTSTVDSSNNLVSASISHFSSGVVAKLSRSVTELSADTFTPSTEGIKAGNVISTGGDFSGDGCEDFFFGFPFVSESNGRISGFYGRGESCSSQSAIPDIDAADYNLAGSSAEMAGTSVDISGDINGDGCSDLVLGAVDNDNAKGKVYVVFNRSTGCDSDLAGTALPTSLDDADLSYAGLIDDDQLGGAVAVGDTNGDSCDDLILGARQSDSGLGKVYLVLGRGENCLESLGTTFPASLSSADASFTGVNADGQLGETLASGGDVNGDGCDDMLLGSPDAASSTGFVYVIFGRGASCTSSSYPSTLASADASFSTDVTEAQLGMALSNSGDINGDGCSDILLGLPGSSSSTGRVAVVFGRGSSCFENAAFPSVASADLSFAGITAGDELGRAVASADFNQDGCADMILGAPGTTSSTGSIYAILGRDDGANCLDQDLVPYAASIDDNMTITGTAESDGFGRAIAIGQNIQGDDDFSILVGAPDQNDQTGIIFLFNNLFD